MKSYRLIAVEAWDDGTGWSYNETAAITDYKTAGNPRRAFLRQLHKAGIVARQGACRVVEEIPGLIELRRRADGEPLYAAAVIEVVPF